MLNVESPREDIEIKEDEANLDNLNYLSGKTMDFVNNKAFEGTLLAHVDGEVPNLIINIPQEKNLSKEFKKKKVLRNTILPCFFMPLNESCFYFLVLPFQYYHFL